MRKPNRRSNSPSKKRSPARSNKPFNDSRPSQGKGSFRSKPNRNSRRPKSGGAGRFKKQTLDPNTLINKSLTQTEQKAVVTRTFASLPLHPKLQARLQKKNFVNTTEIQDKTIEMILEGENIMGVANSRVGTKTMLLLFFLL